MQFFNSKIIQIFLVATRWLNLLQPIALLTARIYMANVFFRSGLTKIRDWDSTLFLFEEEYQVPLLNFEVSAYLATAGELVLPVLLLIGLASRFSALGLAVVNVVAVLSLEDIAPAAMSLHIIWGLLLLLTVLWGAGKLSTDRLIYPSLNKSI